MQQTSIFSSTNDIFNRLSTVLVFSELVLTNIQFKFKEIALSKVLRKLWLDLILLLLQCEPPLTFLLSCVEALIFFKQMVDLPLYI